MSGFRTSKPLRRMLGRLRSRMVRLRHSRGHGVHSPYIYSIVREVFMRRGAVVDNQLGRDLTECGLSRRVVAELQNVYTHCGYGSYAIDADGAEKGGVVADFCISTLACDEVAIERGYREAVASGSTYVVVAPWASVERTVICRSLLSSHQSTAVDRSRYLIIFNNHLPKQYFQL